MKKIVLILCLFIVFLTACEAQSYKSSYESPGQQIIGLWVEDSTLDLYNFAVTGEAQIVRTDEHITSELFQYKFEESNLIFDYDTGETVRSSFSFASDDKLELTWEDGTKSVLNRSDAVIK